MFDSAEVAAADGSSSSEHFDLICCKCVDTYVTVKKNQNQICWKFQKVHTPQPRPPLHRTFLDTQQYSDTSIAQYERVFGRGFISPGGQQISASLLDELQLSEGLKVLDVGCGIGGSAFLAADSYGCHVHGIDLSVIAILVAIERAAAEAGSRSRSSSRLANNASEPGRTSSTNGNGAGAASGSPQQPQQQQQHQHQQLPHDVTFEVADVLTRDFPDSSFDVCISRDSLLHVEDKQALFARLHKWLNPGGRLLITDYCCAASAQTPSASFQAYLDRHRYYLLSLGDYTAALQAAGFVDVTAQDITGQFVESLQTELAGLQADAEGFCARFGPDAYEDMNQRWQGKLSRAAAGEQLWCKVVAVKPLQ